MNPPFSSSPLLASVLFAVALAAPVVAQQGEATYRVTFQSSWSASTHPAQFPSNPHYSPLVGGTHGDAAVFWEPGTLASPGIEQMAETGGTTLLAGEVQQQVSLGTADQVLDYGGAGALGSSPGQLSVTFTARPDFARLTLVSMLAPSPDWFVGLHGFELIAGGDWIDQAVVPANVYDAGTDSGTTYTSANLDTSPPDAIAMVTTASGPFASGPVQVGTFTIERLSSTLVYGCGNPAGSMTVAGAATLGQTLQLSLSDPTGQLPLPAASALALSTTRVAGFPCGATLPGFGLAAGASGEVLLGTLDGLAAGPLHAGGATGLTLPIPNQPALVGAELWLQGLLASSRVGLTEAVAVVVGS